jgi:hypothetical protein
LKGSATPNGIELRRNTRKPNRRRAQRAEVKAAGVVACSELFGVRSMTAQPRGLDRETNGSRLSFHNTALRTTPAP